MYAIQAFNRHLRRVKWLVLVLGTILIVLIAGRYYWKHTYFPATDDAYLDTRGANIWEQSKT